MQAKLIDGKAIAAKIENEIREQVLKMDRPPVLAAILVGDDPASAIYVRNKERAAKRIGIHSVVYRLSGDIGHNELMMLIKQLNSDPEINGILLQSPLPKHLDEHAFMAAIHPDKDVDGFHAVNIGNLLIGKPCFRACTPKGVIRLLKESGVEIAGKHAVVVGRSNIVGKPQALMLLEENATVTVCHSRTQDLGTVTRQADILVAAVGKAEMIRGDMIKPGAVVIDVGINRTEQGLKGDVCFDEALQVADMITPVPGGVGPMTIAMLMENTLEAAKCHG